MAIEESASPHEMTRTPTATMRRAVIAAPPRRAGGGRLSPVVEGTAELGRAIPYRAEDGRLVGPAPAAVDCECDAHPARLDVDRDAGEARVGRAAGEQHELRDEVVYGGLAALGDRVPEEPVDRDVEARAREAGRELAQGGVDVARVEGARQQRAGEVAHLRRALGELLADAGELRRRGRVAARDERRHAVEALRAAGEARAEPLVELAGHHPPLLRAHLAGALARVEDVAVDVGEPHGDREHARHLVEHAQHAAVDALLPGRGRLDPAHLPRGAAQRDARGRAAGAAAHGAHTAGLRRVQLEAREAQRGTQFARERAQVVAVDVVGNAFPERAHELGGVGRVAVHELVDPPLDPDAQRLDADREDRDADDARDEGGHGEHDRDRRRDRRVGEHEHGHEQHVDDRAVHGDLDAAHPAPEREHDDRGGHEQQRDERRERRDGVDHAGELGPAREEHGRREQHEEGLPHDDPALPGAVGEWPGPAPPRDHREGHEREGDGCREGHDDRVPQHDLDRLIRDGERVGGRTLALADDGEQHRQDGEHETDPHERAQGPGERTRGQQDRHDGEARERAGDPRAVGEVGEEADRRRVVGDSAQEDREHAREARADRLHREDRAHEPGAAAHDDAGDTAPDDRITEVEGREVSLLGVGRPDDDGRDDRAQGERPGDRGDHRARDETPRARAHGGAPRVEPRGLRRGAHAVILPPRATSAGQDALSPVPESRVACPAVQRSSRTETARSGWSAKTPSTPVANTLSNSSRH